MTLLPREQKLVRFFAAAVTGRWDEVRRVRREAEPDREWREAALMIHLFAGFPRQLETYEVLDAEGGLGTPEPGEQELSAERPDLGAALFERIYGGQSERVRDRIKGRHPDAEAWVIGHAYGRVLSRPGLSARQRELLAVGALMAFDQRAQLASHVRGAVRCGAAPSELRGILDALRPWMPPEAIEAAEALLKKYSA